MNEYPLPQHAVAVTLREDGALQIYLPPTKQGGKGHSIFLDADSKGMTALVNILRSRNEGKQIIGSAGAPTQHQVDHRVLAGYADAMIRNNTKQAQARARKAEAAAELEELGL